MGLSKSARMQILLAIDVAFFLLELIIGYAVHSLALVADSFHMLNDVLSLCVGLWAVKVAGRQTRSRIYTYGWQRAETLGALVNGVFLVALCLSIFLEAIQRFVEPQEVSSPKLVLIVGCFGLSSNIVGLFLFHEHGHSHGGDREHSHEHGDETRAAEEGHARTHGGLASTEGVVADESGNIADVLPERAVTFPSSPPPMHPSRRSLDNAKRNGDIFSDTTSFRTASTPTSRRMRTRSKSRTYSGLEEIPIHPASFRNEIIAASRLEDVDDQSSEDADNEAENGHVPGTSTSDETITPAREDTPLISKSRSKDSRNRSHSHSHRRKSLSSALLHKSHKHAQPKSAEDQRAHGHSHDLNMRGVFLHVMGDALGNIGVIATALFIWLTDFWWRFYSDPLVSLIITIIILMSALPLCRAASRILLQAVPQGLNVDDIKDDITDIPGILSCHHLHVWQLNDTRLVATLHVQVAFEFKDEGSQRYMQIARQIRECLHEYGIHSSTIQPEFCCERTHGHKLVRHRDDDVAPTKGPTEGATSDEGVNHNKDQCMLDCDDECGDGGKCCGLKFGTNVNVDGKKA